MYVRIVFAGGRIKYIYIFQSYEYMSYCISQSITKALGTLRIHSWKLNTKQSYSGWQLVKDVISPLLLSPVITWLSIYHDLQKLRT